MDEKKKLHRILTKIQADINLIVDNEDKFKSHELTKGINILIKIDNLISEFAELSQFDTTEGKNKDIILDVAELKRKHKL